MLNNETLQSIYDNNCEYLSALSRMEIIDMCQNLARHELAITINDSDNFDKDYSLTIKEKDRKIIEVCWVWENQIKVTLNPVNVTIDYYRKGNWNRESCFKTAFLYCFN